MKLTRTLQALLIAVMLLGWGAAARAADWPPVNPQEVAMKDDPSNPGAAAMILYHESNTDNINDARQEYYRVKIFTEAGKKYGDVEVPYNRDLFAVTDIKARTIRPDGTIVPFTGKIFDKVLAKRGGVNYQAKTFTLPDVQPGCILEYRYTIGWERYYYITPRWIVQDDLFVKRAKFTINQPSGITLAYTWFLPAGFPAPKSMSNGTVQLEVENVPGFLKEPYSLPDDALKMRVLFYSQPEGIRTPDEYWKQQGKQLYKDTEDFIGKRKGVEQEVTRLVQPSDPPETKLRKLYARAQQLRNLSFEQEKTESEEKREKLKESNNAEKVLQRGYGYHNQINGVFAALARAAGFDATLVRVTERDTDVFEPKLMDTDQLRRQLALVHVGTTDVYFDPGTPHCPFGLLPWEDTGVRGVRPGKDGSQFIVISVPSSSQAVRARKADLHLEDDGTVKGTVTITYSGLEALDQRLDALHKDETERRKQVEDAVKGWLPSGALVKVNRVQGWDGTEEPLTAEVSIETPGVAANTGKRVLMPADLLEVNRSNPFEHEKRASAVYLEYPYQQHDDEVLHLPAGWQVESLPPSRDVNAGAARYQVLREDQKGSIHVQRDFHIDGFFFDTKYYSALRGLYSAIGAGDEEQVVLRPGTSQ